MKLDKNTGLPPAKRSTICHRNPYLKILYGRNFAKREKEIIDEHKDHQRKYYRGYYIVNKYNLTQEEYDAMYNRQHGCCAICGSPERLEIKLLSIDHDHTTGKVRGLLCLTCNTLLGMCHDDINILAKAIEYLGGQHDKSPIGESEVL
jgi:hypothetical protein